MTWLATMVASAVASVIVSEPAELDASSEEMACPAVVTQLAASISLSVNAVSDDVASDSVNVNVMAALEL